MDLNDDLSFKRVYDGIENLRQLLGDYICDRIIGKTPWMPDKMRGYEIKKWIEGGNDDVKTYCILDDDYDMLSEQFSNFVKVCQFTGLTDYEVYRAIEILNGE